MKYLRLESVPTVFLNKGGSLDSIVASVETPRIINSFAQFGFVVVSLSFLLNLNDLFNHGR